MYMRKYAMGFVAHCFVVFVFHVSVLSVIVWAVFRVAALRAIVWLFQCQWSSIERYLKFGRLFYLWIEDMPFVHQIWTFTRLLLEMSFYIDDNIPKYRYTTVTSNLHMHRGLLFSQWKFAKPALQLG